MLEPSNKIRYGGHIYIKEKRERKERTERNGTGRDKTEQKGTGRGGKAREYKKGKQKGKQNIKKIVRTE